MSKTKLMDAARANSVDPARVRSSRGSHVPDGATVLMRPSPKGSEPYVKYKIPRTEARLKIKELRKQLKREKRNRSNGK